jgi:hypothetical protein
MYFVFNPYSDLELQQCFLKTTPEATECSSSIVGSLKLGAEISFLPLSE